MRGLKILISVAFLYVLAVYFVLPMLWRHYENHPTMENVPKTTETKKGIPGDPLNVGLIGTRDEIIQALLAAGWYPADPVTFKTSLKIAGSVLLNRPYLDAPVSNLFLWGRPQGLAFEREVGSSARRRHHVRFWQSDQLGKNGRPLWIGAATFDRSVGLDHHTGKVTHHIDPDVDEERDCLIDDLKRAGQLTTIYQVTGTGVDLNGRNGGGDWYHTDGELSIGVVSGKNITQKVPAFELPSPPAVDFKNRIWKSVRRFGKSFAPASEI